MVNTVATHARQIYSVNYLPLAPKRSHAMNRIGSSFLLFIFVLTYAGAASAAAPEAANKNQTTPAPAAPDAPNIMPLSHIATVTTSPNEMPSSTSSASLPVREKNSPSPIIRGTLDNDSRWWKTSERFEIASTDGFNETYDADEPILFYVAGKSDQMDVTKENGFYIAAGLDNLTDNAGDIAAIKYDSDRHAWRVKIAGKREKSKQYEVSIHLACGGGANSPCATVYGNGTIINKILSYQAR